MFGAYRFVLATMVVVTHIGGVEIVAGIAVWGFFMLSGFLMTAVLDRKYGFSGRGLARFAASRAIRLFPTYWISVILTIIVIAFGSTRLDPQLINSALVFPTDVREVFANLAIVGHTVLGMGRVQHALSPSAWAVDVEILMYVCSALFLARNVRVARLTVLAVVAIFPVLWLVSKWLLRNELTEYSNQVIYSFLPAALLPYAVGTWLWHLRNLAPGWLSALRSGFIACLLLLACIFGLSRVSVTAAYILCVPCLAVVLVCLARIEGSKALRTVDTALGWASYPIYLLHWLCAYAVALAVPSGGQLFIRTEQGLHFTVYGFFIVLLSTYVGAAIFAIALESPIERLRQRFTRPTMLSPRHTG